MDKIRQSANEFFKSNPSLKILLPVLMVALIGLLVVRMTSGSSDSGAETANNNVSGGDSSTQVDVLPQTERYDDEDGTLIINNPFSDESGASLSVSGIIQSSSGEYRAIINFEGGAMIVEKDNYLGETEWVVEKIDLNNVYLTSPSGSKTLTIDSDSSVS